ncbi:MAG: N-acetylmuramoyl-L-alanine amidase [Smithellaceae bacterium]
MFDLEAETQYSYTIDKNNLTIEFSGAFCNPAMPVDVNVRKPGIQTIAIATTGDKVTVRMLLDDHLKTQVFKLKKFLDKPDRLVVDIYLKPEGHEKPVVSQPSEVKAFTRVIVIDPGHGGEDPGAVGKRGTYEKDIVLEIGREIKKEIDKMNGFSAVLTRDGDYYVSFGRRLQIASQANAALFISVHADAARNRQARGSSVYCLSTGGATSEAARLLANNENLSDVIGGVQSGETSNESDPIILNMFQTNTINMSKTFASNLIDQIGKIHYLKYDSLQEAPFRVLKLLDIPAVLLETAYLSNLQEEQLLKSRAFHRKIATAVASSVESYFSVGAFISSPSSAAPPVIQAPVTRSRTDEIRAVQTSVYRVKRGDTLYSIARKFDTHVSTLLHLNAMKRSDKLYVGRKILVPGKIADQAPARSTKTYLVRKGDTLYSLARGSSISVEELKRLNNMRDSDVLLMGQRIRVPE